jgi:hypothetical protein
MFYIPMLCAWQWSPYITFPIRNASLNSLMHWLAPVGFMSLMVLIAVIADMVLTCCVFVHAIGRRRNQYPTQVVAAACARYQLLPALSANVDALLDTAIIAARTVRVSHYLYFPFVVMAILALGLFASLEGWTRWPGSFVVIILSVCELSALWLLLRWSAERVRETALEELESAQLAARRNNSGTDVIEQCRLLSEHIQHVHTGAYAPLQEQPIIRAILLPLGGAGAAQLVEYLSNKVW